MMWGEEAELKLATQGASSISLVGIAGSGVKSVTSSGPQQLICTLYGICGATVQQTAANGGVDPILRHLFEVLSLMCHSQTVCTYDSQAKREALAKQQEIMDNRSTIDPDDDKRNIQTMTQQLQIATTYAQQNPDNREAVAVVNNLTNIVQRRQRQLQLDHRTRALLSLRGVLNKRLHIVHERVYKNTTGDGRSGGEVRAWRSIHPDLDEEHWTLHYLGARLQVAAHSCLVRPVREIPVASQYQTLLQFLGYRFDYEYIQEGFVWQDNDGIEIKIYQLRKFDRVDTLSSVHTVSGIRWIVEMNGLCTADDTQLQEMEAKMVAKAKQLHPLVKFTKIAPT